MARHPAVRRDRGPVRALLPILAINIVVVGLFVAIGIALSFPLWVVLAFVVETLLSIVAGLRLLR